MENDFSLQRAVQVDGTVLVDDLVQILRTSKLHLAAVLGLPLDALSKDAHLAAETIQRTLKDLIDVLTRVSRWAGSPLQAFAWFTTQSVPSFGDQTCADLMREGRATTGTERKIAFHHVGVLAVVFEYFAAVNAVWRGRWGKAPTSNCHACNIGDLNDPDRTDQAQHRSDLCAFGRRQNISKTAAQSFRRT